MGKIRTIDEIKGGLQGGWENQNSGVGRMRHDADARWLVTLKPGVTCALLWLNPTSHHGDWAEIVAEGRFPEPSLMRTGYDVRSVNACDSTWNQNFILMVLWVSRKWKHLPLTCHWSGEALCCRYFCITSTETEDQQVYCLNTPSASV